MRALKAAFVSQSVSLPFQSGLVAHSPSAPTGRSRYTRKSASGSTFSLTIATQEVVGIGLPFALVAPYISHSNEGLASHVRLMPNVRWAYRRKASPPPIPRATFSPVSMVRSFPSGS